MIFDPIIAFPFRASRPFSPNMKPESPGTGSGHSGAQCTPFVQNAGGLLVLIYFPGYSHYFHIFCGFHRFEYKGIAPGGKLPVRLPAFVDFTAFDQVPATALNDYVKTTMVLQVKGDFIPNQDGQLVLIVG